MLGSTRALARTLASLVVVLAACTLSTGRSGSDETSGRSQAAVPPYAGLPQPGDRVSGTVWVGYEGDLARDICWAASGIELPGNDAPRQCEVTMMIADVAHDASTPPNDGLPYRLAHVEGTYLSQGQLEDVIISQSAQPPADDGELASACAAQETQWVQRIADDVEQSAVLSELERRADLVTQYAFTTITPTSNVIVASSVHDPTLVRAQLQPLWPNVCVLPAQWERNAMLSVAEPLENAASQLHWLVQRNFDGGVTLSMLILSPDQGALLAQMPGGQVRVDPDLAVVQD